MTTTAGSNWIWHRLRQDGTEQFAYTDTLAPPKGRGWTLAPGHGPGLGPVEGIDSYTPTRQSVGKRSRRASEDSPRA